jgi:outer membrane biosynthesis protein TonB
MSPTDDTEHRARSTAGLAGGALSMLTREAARLPLFAITMGLQGIERARSVRDFAVRRGSEALQLAALTPLGRFLPDVSIGDNADAEATRIADDARQATERAVLKPVPNPTAAADTATPTPTPPIASQPTPKPAAKPAPKPAAQTAPKTAPQRSAAAVEAGAPGAATAQADEVAESLDIDEPQSRDELPIPDFDNVSLGSLRARLRSLSVEQLVVLREWEQAHAHRLPVMTLLDNRIAKVSAADSPAYPAEGASTVRV